MAKRSGKESFTFVDRITGRQVLQLTNSGERSVHGYYDLPPWNLKTGQVAFTSLAPAALEGDVYIMDRDGSNLTYLAHSRAVSANDGAMAQWSVDGRRVYLKDRQGEESLIAWVDVTTGKAGSYPGSLRMICPTGNANVYFTECSTLPDHEVVRGRPDHGVFVQDLDNGTSKRVVSVEACRLLNPRRDEIADWHLYIKHTKWSPDGKRIMFVFTNEIPYAQKFAEMPHVKDIYVVNADGTGLKRVGEFGNHPLWHPDGKAILTNSPFEGRQGNSLVLLDVETGKRTLASRHMSGSGHPSYSPDGKHIMVDHVLEREGYGSLNMVEVADDSVEHMVQVRIIDHSHVGTHLHPVWSRDGKQVLYDSDGSGVAQLCVINIAE